MKDMRLWIKGRCILRNGAIGLTIACTLVVAFCAAYSVYEQRQAREFLGVFADLKPGVTSDARVKEDLQSFRPAGSQLQARQWNLANNRFNVAYGYGYEFNNEPLAFFHLARHVKLDASLYFRDGILVAKLATLEKDTGACCLAAVKETSAGFGGSPNSNCKPDSGACVERRGNPPGELLVEIEPGASEEDRRRAYQFNLGCLTSLTECQSASDLIHGFQ
jgi:hypothetical protein